MNKPTTARYLNTLWEEIAATKPENVLPQGHEGCSKECEAKRVHMIRFTKKIHKEVQ